ncbi:MAG TPA: hypothetical protein VMZ28_00610, partial [Kofleriaceae bacterium]|nr:hypothetical protein [Kofleriaceae bacterium]
MKHRLRGVRGQWQAQEHEAEHAQVTTSYVIAAKKLCIRELGITSVKYVFRRIYALYTACSTVLAWLRLSDITLHYVMAQSEDTSYIAGEQTG